MLNTSRKLLSRFVLLGFFVGTNLASGSMVSITEEEKRDYLKLDAEINFSCTYVPLHYIDLNADLHTLKAVQIVDGSYEGRSHTPEEVIELKRVLAKLPMFTVDRVNSVNIWFSPISGATEEDVVNGLYEVKLAVSKFSLLFLQSSADCTGVVSVNNL